MDHIASRQPNEAMAQCPSLFSAPQQPNGKQKKLLVPSYLYDWILWVLIQDSKRPAPRRLLFFLG
jgi:hypothetical protein